MQKAIGLYEDGNNTICQQLNEYLKKGYTVSHMLPAVSADGEYVMFVLNIPEKEGKANE